MSRQQKEPSSQFNQWAALITALVALINVLTPLIERFFG